MSHFDVCAALDVAQVPVGRLTWVNRARRRSRGSKWDLHMKDPINAGDICTCIVAIACPSMALNEAARVMQERHVGGLVVVEELSPQERVVVGMLTDRDITLGVVAADRDPHGMRVGDLMTKDVLPALEQDSVLDRLAAMRPKGVRRIPITGPRGTLIGIVTLDDVLEIVAQEMQAVGSAVGASKNTSGRRCRNATKPSSQRCRPRLPASRRWPSTIFARGATQPVSTSRAPRRCPNAPRS